MTSAFLRTWFGIGSTPTVLQMESTECGAACLGIILAHFGRYVPLEQLREDCGVSRDGSSASNIAKAARSYGLEVEAFSGEPGALHELHFPLIAHWNFNHFVVVEAVGNDRAYLNDPATGPRTIGLDELDESFTGVVLAFRPGPGFERGGVRSSVVRSLRERLPGARLGIAYVILLGALLVAPGLLIPVFSKVFIDEILVAGKTEWIIPLVVAVIVAYGARTTISMLRRLALLKLSLRIEVTGSSRFMWHVLRLPVRFFDARLAGDIASRLRVNDTLATVISGRLAEAVLNLLLAAFFGAMLAYYDGLLAAVVFVFAALHLITLKLLVRRRVNHARRMEKEIAALAGVSMGGLQLIESIKASGSEPDFFSRWSGHYARSVSVQQQYREANLVYDAVPSLLSLLERYLVLGIGALRVMDGDLTLGTLVAFQSIASSFMEPVRGVAGFATELQTLDSGLSRLDDVLSHPPDPLLEDPVLEDPRLEDPRLEAANGHSATSEVVPAGRLTGRLVLEDLSFGYSRLAAPVLSDLSLVLEPGHRVAVVGSSGSGKSTLVKLLCGLYEPWEGRMLLGGFDRRRLPRSVVNRTIGLVSQDISLFEGTVRENITMWDPTVPEQVMMDAARDAAIHDEIMSRVGGYDSRVEEGGRNFSGGQRQRLEIARVLAQSPSLLVLDEATSALDPATEKLVDDNLRRRGCTCVVVAHRLSTIRDCNEIIVLDRGVAVERGTHEQLVRQAGPYVGLIRSVE
ncbi:NHLP family bacteriocin export ABC transporter peptidase/permease/ATPase subunit [Paraliomyxa miuraensis]|uniref:NHLP family bacteriocin export ABC transporter peptidase/permease/ATPase subunit n=1 Tax=Paraliomyxa miuraensis TaxID=376150 RepID=UPI0022525523|nr:NHLP family bacteriocin export ABC transporter peptidase/permease/ATPase subunit [Paraliomyxa miuraensis]MCX4241597.1 NHLP family bacteriocin export ABC transporter peptidase/permease/ATPase subunit [Paraliomyxa miuraensis]